MRRVLIIFAIFVFLFGLGALGYQLLLARTPGKGALQVTSNPRAKVYLDSNLIGETPIDKSEPNTMIAAGEHTIRIVMDSTGFSVFEEKIPITKGALTVVDRTFGKGSQSEGSIITLTALNDKKSIQLFVVSFPDSANILLDANPVGYTPFLQKDITESDHELKLQKTGYKDKIVRIHTVAGYKLNATVFLGINTDINSVSSSSAALEQNSASVSASITSSPVSSQKIIILQTPTGFLRVHQNADINSLEIARVNPGETYDLLSEQSGWFQIKLQTESSGWISSQYAQKQLPAN